MSNVPSPNQTQFTTPRIVGGILIGAAVLGVVCTLVWDTFVKQMARSIPSGGPPTGERIKDNFYYGPSYATRYEDSFFFSELHLKQTDDGPWIWIQGDDGFQVGSDAPSNCAERVATAFPVEIGNKGDTVFVHFSTQAYLRFDSPNKRGYKFDALICDRVASGRKDIPVEISLTKEGPRIKLPVTEEELRKAFGPPTKTEMRTYR